MAIIYSYPLNDNIKSLDELVGTTEKNINGQLKTVTRNFLLQDLAEFFIVDGGIQKTIILTTEGDSGAATLDQVTGILNIPEYAGLQNLQQVTDLGNVTSNSMRVELANSYSQINVSNIGTENTTLSTYAYLRNNGSISIKSGAAESNIKNTSVTNSGVILEFPNKTSGSYTIATTSDVIAQNLQQVTDVGASTTNPIIVTALGDDAITAYAGSGTAITGNAPDGTAVYGTSINGDGIVGYSETAPAASFIGIDKGIKVTAGNTFVAELNQGLTSKGLVINSGTSSTGNFIELDKNGVDKLTVNQQGTLTINTINANGLNINTSGTNSSKSPIVITSTVSEGVAFACYSYNGSLGNYIYSDSGDSISLQADYPLGLGLNITSLGGGITAYSINLPVVELYQALTNKGLVINSGTSSTGNFIELAKNSVNKLIVNQLGELTAQKLIKDGGTSSQILAADGSVITQGNNITISGGTISSVGGTGGGGSSVNYYLNGGTTQGTFGGTTYYEFSKTAVIGTGADFSRGSNGLIASFITDVADPSLLLIPAGNWNLEFFFSASSNGGSPKFYVELYKYDGTTFTLIASNSATPEGITNGTAIDAYFTPLAVPETVLTVNDRLAIRVFVNASSKTITLHTQNGHLCEVITTFTAGLTALNGLQAQVQNFATGTTGTDFAINSSGSTHTFNLPSASLTARGVVTTGGQTFAGTKTFSSNIVIPAVGSELILSVGSGGTVSGLTTSTYASPFELTYVKGVTSSIQTQFSGKQASSAKLTSLSGLTYASTSFVKMTGADTFTLDTNTYLTSAVTTLSGGTTGLTPSAATSGAVTLAGTLNILNGGTGATTAPQARINLGGSTLGINIFTATSPSAITFLRINADNTPSYLNAADFRTAIGVSTTGITSLSAIGTDPTANANGATITGSVLNLQPATANFGGVVTTSTQTFAGVKIFNSSPFAPTKATGTNNTEVATTAFVTNSINAATPGTGYGVFNILISPTGNITTEEPGASGGVSYAQNGRNVMINNGATVININATNAVDGFIASYTKIGSAAITFTATSPVVFVNPVNGVTLNGDPNSTALLVKNGNNIYLSINNLL